jgi:hypothetical protein
MLDSPITLLLLGISAASAIASYAAHRRKRQSQQLSAPALSNLSDADLLAALASLQPSDTNAAAIAQHRAAHPARHSISVAHPASEIRDAHYPVSATWVEHDVEVRRRITLLVIEELKRRGPPPAPFK